MSSSPSAVLASAMDQAESAGQTIPCKDEPEAFTSDLLAFTGSGTHAAAELVRRCAGCPVLGECREYADDARRSKKTELYGVVAGRLEVARRYVAIDTRELTHA